MKNTFKNILTFLLLLSFLLGGCTHETQECEKHSDNDANGVCEFTLAPYTWEIHTLMVPEGYEGDTETVTTAPVEGGEMTFTLTKK